MSESKILFKGKDRMCILTKVLNVIPGEGRSEGWKTGLLVSAGRQQVVLNCWNSKNPEKPQMATRAAKLSPGDTIIALIIASNGEYSCIAYLKDEGVLSIDNGGHPVFIVYGNIRIDNSPGDTFRIAVPLHYKDKKQWHFCSFAGEENCKKAKAAVDGAKKIIFTAIEGEKVTLKNGDTAYRYKGHSMFKVGGDDIESVVINIGPYRKCPTRLGDLFNNSPGRRRDVLYWLKYVDEVYEPVTEEEKVQKKAISAYLDNVAC